MLPRYFVPRSDLAPAPPPRAPLLLHVVDLLELGGAERAVVVDRAGALHLVDPSELPSALVAELHHHELLAGGRVRRLDVVEPWLLSVQLLEQPADAPGLNDPVYLYGRWFAPHLGSAADGQLALTRADLLDGFVRSAGDAFSVATDPPTRCLHAVLPADRAEEVEQKRGVVLAYPLVPAELLAGDPGNELLVASLVYDLLVATQVDARRPSVRATVPSHPLDAVTIPVPSRADLERDLDAQGWDIRGDQAVRRTEATKKGSIGSVFAQVFGVPDAMKLDLPPEGTLDQLLALAAIAVPAFPGYPDRRAAAVRSRTQRGPAPSVAQSAVPKAPRPVDPSARRGPELRPPADDWMNDFVASHGPNPRISRPARPAAKPERATERPAARPDWMGDFDE